jgi:hypothetical protein
LAIKGALSSSKNDVTAIAVITPGESFTLYEAKREGETLDQHVPQAVAQCLALAEL